MTEKSNSIQHEAIEVAVRIGLIVLIALYCLAIVRPFITMIIWGGIIAVAFYPLHRGVTNLLKGRQKLAAFLFTITLLGVLLLPTVILGVGSFSQATYIYDKIQLGTLTIPPPTESVAEWPLVGEKLYELWKAASSNLESLLLKYNSVVF